MEKQTTLEASIQKVGAKFKIKIKKLIIFWGLKMHCQNIVDGDVSKNNVFKLLLKNKVYVPNFANRYFLDPFLNILL